MQGHGAGVASLAREAQVRHPLPSPFRDLGGRDVRLEGGHAEHPYIDHDDVDAGAAELVSDERVLATLGVQRADEDRGTHLDLNVNDRKAPTVSEMARSTGSRSMLDAPRKPSTSVRA